MPPALAFLLRLAAFLACALYMGYKVDMGRAFAVLLRMDPVWIAAATGFILLSIFFNGARVRVLAGRRISLLIGTNSTVLALAANIILPGRLGEVAKISMLRLQGIGLGETLRIIFFERLIDLNLSGTLVLVFVGLFFPEQRAMLVAVLTIAWIVLVLALTKPHAVQPFFQRLLALLSAKPRLRNWLDNSLGEIFARTPGNQLVGLAIYSVLALASYLFAIDLVIRFACGIDLPWLSVFSASCVGMLSLAVPTTPGSLGVYEAGMVWVLGMLGVDAEHALTAAVVSHAIQIFPILPWAGLITLLGKGRQAPANT